MTQTSSQSDRSPKPRMKWAVIAAVCVCLAAPTVVVSLAFGPAELCCVKTQIDVNSGDVRHTRYIFFVPITKRVEQTAFSRLVRQHLTDLPDPIWRHVETTDTPLQGVFDYGPWHSAVWTCNWYAKALAEFDVPEDRMADLLSQRLNELQSGEQDKILESIDDLGSAMRGPTPEDTETRSSDRLPRQKGSYNGNVMERVGK